MGCCSPRTSSPAKLQRNSRQEDVLLQIPGATVHLTEEMEAAELANGEFSILRITEEGVQLATAVKIGAALQWPLTKDEPVIKLDQLHYLFSLPDKDGGFLNYGVSFAGPDSRLAPLDQFLKENTCFSVTPDPSTRPAARPYEVYWKDYAPRIDAYNGVLAKAIAGGTGEIVKGIFKCSNAYTSQVQKGAYLIQHEAVPKSAVSDSDKGGRRTEPNKSQGGINGALRRVRMLSETTEHLSRTLLDGVLTVSGSVAIPLIRSKAGRSFLSMVPGEVLLASLDGINKVLDAVEVAQRRSLAATSNRLAGAVSKKFGESAGEATEDAFATAGHAIGTAWNIFKIRKAVNPSSLPSNILKNAARKSSL